MLPDLPRRLELRALRDAAEPNVYGGGMFRRGGVERGAAFWAKNLRSTIATLRGLDVALRLAVQDERFDRCRYNGPKRCARKNLAIGAMAHGHARWVDFGGERNQAAMTRTVNLHGMYLCVMAGGDA